MTRRDFIIKYTAYGVALAVITILNYYILGRLPMSVPLLIPTAAVAAGILESPKFGAGFGLTCGLVMASLGHQGLVCIPALAAVGWLCGLVSQNIIRRNLAGSLICTVILLGLWELCQVGYLLLTRHISLLLLIKTALPELLWSLVFSFPVYWAIRFCCIHYGRVYHE